MAPDATRPHPTRLGLHVVTQPHGTLESPIAECERTRENSRLAMHAAPCSTASAVVVANAAAPHRRHHEHRNPRRSSAPSLARHRRSNTATAASAVQSSEDERLTWDEIEKVVNADVVRSVMTSRVLSIGPDASVFDAMKLLVDNRISAVPVVDGDRQVLGVVSEYDLMARVGKKEVTKSVQDDGMFPRVGRCDEYNGNVKEMWSQFHNLQERMSKASGSKVSAAMHDATTCVPDMRLVDATELMLRDNLARLPVVDEQGRLVGILSRGDIMRRTFQAFMLAQQSVNQEEFARSVMALDASDPAINTQINTNAALDAFCDATPDDDECRIYED